MRPEWPAGGDKTHASELVRAARGEEIVAPNQSQALIDVTHQRQRCVVTTTDVCLGCAGRLDDERGEFAVDEFLIIDLAVGGPCRAEPAVMVISVRRRATP
jgi:hypothetical protein